MSDAALHRVTDSWTFRASAAAYLVLDRDLRIRAANHPYELATLHRSADMIGEFMFDVFPDNPDAPEARSVDNLARSLESVLRHADKNRMGLQRYDVRDPYTEVFVTKTWLPVNSPIFDADGRVVAVLHHVEDVTRMVQTTSLERLLSKHPATALPGGDALAEFRDFAERVRRDADSRRRSADALVSRSSVAMDRAAHTLSLVDRALDG